MISGSRQLMDRIKRRFGNDSSKIQTGMRLFAMEQFLVRLSQSSWRDNFILKGGLLVTALVGTEMRSTMDIDATVDGFTLDEAELSRIIEEICSVDVGDEMTFHVKSAERIMDEHEYPGIRMSMEALFDRARIPMKLDFSTGDAVTPKAVEFGYPCILEDGDIPVMAYNIETLLAEKLETLVSRGIANTRMRDFYDITHCLK